MRQVLASTCYNLEREQGKNSLEVRVGWEQAGTTAQSLGNCLGPHLKKDSIILLLKYNAIFV